MRRRIVLSAASVLAVLIACCGHVAAVDVGDVVMDVTANSATADADAGQDFDWSIIEDGPWITITVDCEFDDNNVAVDFIFTTHINCNWNDSSGVIDNQHDEWTNPNYYNTDNSAIWPMGQFAYDTLSVTFTGPLDVNQYIDVEICVDVINYNPNPPVYAHDVDHMTITIVA